MSSVKKQLTRRQLLRGAVGLASGAVLAACAQPTAAPQPAQAPAAPAPGATAVPTKAAAPAAAGACGVTAPGTFPVAKDKVTLSIFMIQSPLVKDMPTNELTLWYEEKTNVHIEWQMVPQQGLAEKRNLVLASGQYPDIFMGAGIPNEDLFLYGQQGVLIPLNDLVDKQLVHAKALFAENQFLRDAITAPDGKIYALGHDSQCFHCTMGQRLWINQKWLDKVGMKMPTTTDEFYAVLQAFKTKDPNGNGKADEIPLMGATDSNGPEIIGNLMNAFTYYDRAHREVFTNGKIDVPYNKPDFRDGIAWLAKLYAEKLIDPTALTMQAADLRKLGEKEDAQVLGAVASFYPGSFQSLAGERHKDYAIVPPLKGPKGVQLHAWWPYTAVTGEFAITKSCKCPEVAIRWIDWFFSMEGGLRSRIGREGQEWRKAEPGEKGLDGRPALWIKLTPINEQQNYFWGQVNIPQQFIHSTQSACDDIYAACGLEKRLYDATKQLEPFKPKEVVPPLWIPKEDLSKYAQTATDLRQYVDQTMARFISGELKVDAEWDNYIKQLDRIGLKDYLAIMQKAYDAKYKKS